MLPDEVLSRALVQAATNKVYPEEDVVVAEVPPTALSKVVKELRVTQDEVKVVSFLNRTLSNRAIS